MAYARGSAGRVLAGLRQFVGEIHGREDRDAQRIHGTALRSDGAHLGVHLRGQLADVLLIFTGKVIRLIVDLDGDVVGGVLNHTPPYNSSASSCERSFSTRW